MHLLLLGTLALAGGADFDPCPKPGQCFEGETSDNFGVYVRSLDHVLDTLVAPRDPFVQMLEGSANVYAPIGGVDADVGDVWTEFGSTPGDHSHMVEHWFLDVPLPISSPSAAFGFDFDDRDTTATEMVDILMADPDYTNDTYLRMDLYYATIPDIEDTEDLDYEGDSVDRHTFRGWRDGEVASYLLREVHYDASGAVERRLDFWVLFGDTADEALLGKPGDRMEMERVEAEPTPRTFFAWMQANDNLEKKRATVAEYTPGTIYDSPLF